MESDTEQYLSPGQSKKILGFGMIALFASLPIKGVSTIIPVPFITEYIEDFLESVISGFTTALELIATYILGAMFHAVGFLFTFGTRQFLFFTPPGAIEPLHSVWYDFLPIFWALLPVVGAAFFLGMTLFPENEQADIYRFMERSLVAAIALILTSPALNFEVYVPGFVGGGDYATMDLFSAVVLAVNAIGEYVFPSTYGLDFMAGSLNALMGGFAAAVTTGGVVIAALFFGWKFVIGILLVVGTFYLVLAMRMLLVYTVWAMMPLFLALWIVDIGPLKYGKMVTSLVFKLTAMLLLLGIVISGILATTQAIAGQEEVEDDGLGFTDEFDDPDEELGDGIVTSDGDIQEDAMEGGEASSAEPPSGAVLALLQIFAWFGGIILTIALTTSLLGMVISARGSSGTKSRARQGRKADAPTGPQVFGGGGSGGSGDGAGGGQGPVVTTTDDGTTVIDGGPHSETTVMDDDGNMTTFDPAGGQSPDQPEEVPLRDKARYLGGKAKDRLGDADEKYTGGQGGEMTGAITDRTKQAYDNKVPDIMKKGGNLAKRGGVAYGKVFAQPTVEDSISEMGRIARESDIAHPGKAGGPDEVGAAGKGEAGVAADGEPGGLDSDDLYNASIGELADNPEKFEDGRFNLEQAEFRSEGKVSDVGKDNQTMQKGELVDPESGDTFKQVGFGVDEDAPELEDGEVYDLENVGFREWNEDAPHAHSGVEGDYMQLQMDEHSEATKISDSDARKEKGDVGGGGTYVESGDVDQHEYDPNGGVIEYDGDIARGGIDQEDQFEIGNMDEAHDSDLESDDYYQVSDDVTVTSEVGKVPDGDDTIGVHKVRDETSDQRFTDDGGNVNLPEGKNEVQNAKYDFNSDAAPSSVVLTDDTEISDADPDANAEFRYGNLSDKPHQTEGKDKE